MGLTVYIPEPNRIVHTTSADMALRGINDVIHLVQYDKRTPILKINLLDNNAPYYIPDGMNANIRLKKPDGYFVYNPVIGMNQDGNAVYVEATLQMTSANGDARFVIEIISEDGTTVASSGDMRIAIDVNPVLDTDIESTYEYKSVEGMVDEAQQLLDQTLEAKTQAQTYAGASNTYSQNSAASATDAETAKTEAEAAKADAETAQANAELAKADAETAKTDAEGAKADAEKAKIDAENAVLDAKAAADRAEEAATKVVNVYKFKGSVATKDDLPTTGNEIGDVWDVLDTGANYAWTAESKWDALGGLVGGGVDAIEISREDYEKLGPDKLTDGKLYIIYDEENVYSAEQIAFNNSVSGLKSNNVQSAIDELINMGSSDFLTYFNELVFVYSSYTDIAEIPIPAGKKIGFIMIQMLETGDTEYGYRVEDEKLIIAAKFTGYNPSGFGIGRTLSVIYKLIDE